MCLSVLDFFRVGIGPSSSHTVGPMRAGARFLQSLGEHVALGDIQRIRVELFGSLSATGRGHATDKAVILGLMGQHPESVDPDSVEASITLCKHNSCLLLNGTQPLYFDWSRDILFKPVSLPWHPNALRLTAFCHDIPLFQNTYYSTGGGFIVEEAQIHANKGNSVDREQAPTPLPHPFADASSLLQICAATNAPISTIMLENESAWRSKAKTRQALLGIWSVMQACIERGIHQNGILPGGLQVQRRASKLHHELLARQHSDNFISQTFNALDWVNLFALAVNEENAAGGRVVTAPTNGAAGIIPAVLQYFMRFHTTAGDDDVVRFLLTAGAIGILLKKNASISGAEVGCQGEVGSACAMAAAGLAEILGGSPAQVENAAEIGLEHNLGLTCDPIAGLVQIPCIERNAMAAVKAINAVQLALRGDGTHRVTLDQAIRTMRDTGRDMLDKYKETSRGGLAVNFTAC